MVSMSAFSFLFSEIVQYMMKQELAANNQRNLTNAQGPPVPDLEQQLHQLGIPIGERVLELCTHRDKGNSTATNSGKRELGIVNMLHYINGTVWKTLFGKAADGLEQSNNDDSEYWILEKSPVTNKFTSFGKNQLGGANCAFFVAGILEGLLCSSGFHAKVVPVIRQ